LTSAIRECAAPRPRFLASPMSFDRVTPCLRLLGLDDGGAPPFVDGDEPCSLGASPRRLRPRSRPSDFPNPFDVVHGKPWDRGVPPALSFFSSKMPAPFDKAQEPVVPALLTLFRGFAAAAASAFTLSAFALRSTHSPTTPKARREAAAGPQATSG